MKKVSIEYIKKIAEKANVDISKFDINQVLIGYEVEKEHGDDKETDVTKKDPIKTLKITVRHLKEDGKYYDKLLDCVEGDKIEEEVNPWAVCHSTLGPKKIRNLKNVLCQLKRKRE